MQRAAALVAVAALVLALGAACNGGSDAELTRKVTGDLDVSADGTFVIGSPHDCIEQLARYKELGFNKVCLRLFYPGMSEQEVLDHIELVGRDVLPELHSL